VDDTGVTTSAVLTWSMSVIGCVGNGYSVAITSVRTPAMVATVNNAGK